MTAIAEQLDELHVAVSEVEVLAVVTTGAYRTGAAPSRSSSRDVACLHGLIEHPWKA